MVMKSLYSEVGGRADIHNWGAPRCGRREISPHSMTMIQCLRRNMQNSKGMGIHINPSCFDVKPWVWLVAHIRYPYTGWTKKRWSWTWRRTSVFQYLLQYLYTYFCRLKNRYSVVFLKIGCWKDEFFFVCCGYVGVWSWGRVEKTCAA